MKQLCALSRAAVRGLLRDPHTSHCRAFLGTSSRLCSTGSKNEETKRVEKDPGRYFFQPEIHSLLKKLTGYDEGKIFARQPRKANTKAPKYEFMKKDEYEKLTAEFRKKGEKLLQMPPVVKERVEIDQVLSEDPELKGYDRAKYVFTDITYGVSDRKRLIVVREPDGTLRKAKWEERDRINHAYFPSPRKLHRTPEMFESAENLDKVLERKDYLFVLNRACWQFEPDHPTYRWVVARTYDHVDGQRAYEELRSTRHYGPMVFHLAWNRAVDNLVVDLIDADRLSDAADVVKIFYLIHPNSSVDQSSYPEKALEYLEAYRVSDSLKRGVLELALQHYKEKAANNREKEDVKEAASSVS